MTAVDPFAAGTLTDSNDMMHTLDELVESRIAAGYFPGAVVAVGCGDGCHLLKAYGHAQVKPRRVAMQQDTLFDIESVTKVATLSSALAILIEEGEIDLEKPAKAKLAGLRERGSEPALVRHLVTHTSGYRWQRVLGHGRVLEPEEEEDLFAKLLTMDLNGEPGTRFNYSNRGAILAGMIVEEVAGVPLGEFCAERVFEPLGMTATRFGPVPAEDGVAASRSSVVGRSANEDVLNAHRPIGTTGLFSSAIDLDRYCRFWLNRGALDNVRLFSESVWKLATSNLSPIEEHRYGLFWMLEPRDHRPTGMSEKAFGHGGHTGQSIWIDPERNAYTVIMTNRGHPFYIGTDTPGGRRSVKARAEIGDALLQVAGHGQGS